MNSPGFKAMNLVVAATTDFSVASPKLRFSAIGYLLDNKFLDVPERTPEQLVEFAEAIVNFVTSSQEDFTNSIKALELEYPETAQDAPESTPASFGSSAYL